MNRNTVYVIGAGASCEVNLPSGNQLKEKVAKILNMRFDFHRQLSGDADILAELRGYTSEDQTGALLNSYITECQYISENMPLAISIDNFIDANRGNEKLALCGKVAILKSILEAEKSSKLKFDGLGGVKEINFSVMEGTWYLPFFRSLTENCSLSDLPSRFSSITVIIFNYDRCVEHFLFFSLMSYYRISEKEAAELIRFINIIHPYGTVGSLPWFEPDGQRGVSFGGEVYGRQLINYAKSIRTFTEGAHSNYIEKIKFKMENARRLVFLGFAFHPLNMQLLGGGYPGNKYNNEFTIKCYATAYETSKSDQDEIRSSVQSLYSSPVVTFIENCTCEKIFHNYSKTLGFSQ